MWRDLTVLKVLIVAHPDDEILWFNPSYFDRIYITFLGRNDKPEMKDKRLKCIRCHPFKERITLLSLCESGYWKDPKKCKEHHQVKTELTVALQNIAKDTQIKEVFTHNPSGEYGHSDHILVHECIATIFSAQCDIWMPYKFILASK